MYPIEDITTKHDIFVHTVKTIEVVSESLPQLAMNLWIIKNYGITDNIQIMSGVLSIITFFKSLADKMSFIIHGKDVGILSMTFLKCWADLLIAFISVCTLSLHILSDDNIPPWLILVTFLLAHPVVAWITNPKIMCFKLAKPENGKNHYTSNDNILCIIVVCLIYTFRVVSYYVD